MTTVNVATQANTVKATTGGSTTVVENSTPVKVSVTANGATTVVESPKAANVEVTENGSSTVVQSSVTATVTATTAGPQGAAGSNFTLDQTAKVDKSIVYYDSASGEYKADATWTISTLVLGGNF